MDYEDQLSKNFTIAELCSSTTADNHQLHNEPGQAERENLRRLAVDILQPIRDQLGKPLIINSGYRSKEVNKLVGGAKNSYHLKGMAADIHADNMAEACTIAALALGCELTDMVIIEKRGKKYWTHVQYSMAPRHVLRYDVR